MHLFKLLNLTFSLYTFLTLHDQRCWLYLRFVYIYGRYTIIHLYILCYIERAEENNEFHQRKKKSNFIILNASLLHIDRGFLIRIDIHRYAVTVSKHTHNIAIALCFPGFGKVVNSLD